MKKIISNLIMYGDMPGDCILVKLADIIERVNKNPEDKDSLVTEIYVQIKRLLTLATDYGFDDNLWHNYLTYILVNSENPFTLMCEKRGAMEGSVNEIAINDCRQFVKLFRYDFGPVEKTLGISCFSLIENYHSIAKDEKMYNKNVSEKIRNLSKKLGKIQDEREFFHIITGFYNDYGVGEFGLNKAFRVIEKGDDVAFKPINNMDPIVLDDLIGYDLQKQKLIDNTEAFVEGRRCNNCLLIGDSGTGKSSSIKAIVNQYYDRGLRMIEIYKHQFKNLSNVIAKIKNRNYRFIIYMDDLSFEDFEVEYKFLKAVIEGGVETKPENILIYATSNRRHLIKESWDDRKDVRISNGLHSSDTMEEKLSLAYRFGVTITYIKPSAKEYQDIALALCRRLGVEDSDEAIIAEAKKWELRGGGLSGRTAQQFANYMAGRKENDSSVSI